MASDNNPDIVGPPQHTSLPQAFNRAIKHDFEKTKLRVLISNFQSIKAKRDHGTYCVTVYRVTFAVFYFHPPSLENGFARLKIAQIKLFVWCELVIIYHRKQRKHSSETVAGTWKRTMLWIGDTPSTSGIRDNRSIGHLTQS